MARILLIHWNQKESAARAGRLRRGGHRVRVHWSQETTAKISEPYPEAVVISLDRLPAHGRAVAEWLWEAKKRRQIRLIFAGGQPEKVEVAREKFPEAQFASWEELPAVLP